MASVLDTNNALITLAELKGYLSSDNSDEFLTDTSTDNEIEYIINAASVFANQYTGVDLLSREHTEYYKGDGTSVLFVDNFPVTSTVSEIDLWIDSDREYTNEDKVEAEDIILDAAIGEIQVEDEIFPSMPQSVKITYTAGYTLANVPGDLKYAIKLICAKFWKDKKNKLVSMTSLNIDGSSVTLAEENIPKTAAAILDHYSRARF
jgi:hypothetical protein